MTVLLRLCVYSTGFVDEWNRVEEGKLQYTERPRKKTRGKHF